MKHPSGSSSAALSAWWPRLFVNRADFICAEYIGYFEHREWMEKIGAGEIERVASQHSVAGFLVHAVASKMGKPSSEEPLHLIPSARLTVNLSPGRRRDAHGIKQWWGSDLLLESNVYKYM
ncbi:UNVERIFIED_CONTAM: GDSL esterase/lipase [Sesamum latifolium]|uniref:GDSL esterase/lipase n=1 Tax=Sesamum latifolium TaxID=2727402 RepID=A0AAW2SPX3_9LAMI